MISFGFGLITCQRHPADPRSDSDRYAEVLALAETSERLGYDAVWVSEHHFFDDSYMTSLLPVCAAIAARTTTLRIGTSLLLAPLYDPVRLAEDAATVDLISRGRLTLGLGQGWRQEELDAFGVERGTRHRRLEETIEVLQTAWSANGVVTGGEFHRYPDVVVTPKPASADGPPIWVGGEREPAVRRAGRLGAGYMAPYEMEPRRLERQLGWVREELMERPSHERERFTVSVCPPTFAWHDGDAWETVLPYQGYVHGKYAQYMAGARSVDGPLGAPPPTSAADEELLRERTVSGTPEQVLERVVRYGEAVGGDFHFIARLYWPGMDPSMRVEAMTIFAEEVAAPARRHFAAA